MSNVPSGAGSSPPFKSHLVLNERIAEATIRAYYVGFDQNIFRLRALANVIVDVIPEFAMGYYQGTSVSLTDIMPRAREAAKRIYTTDKYQKRGEFGELILHLLLRDFCRSIPLISKIQGHEPNLALSPSATRITWWRHTQPVSRYDSKIRKHPFGQSTN